jgi:hypothetical protein
VAAVLREAYAPLPAMDAMLMLRAVDHRGLLIAIDEVIEKAVPRKMHDIGEDDGRSRIGCA